MANVGLLATTATGAYMPTGGTQPELKNYVAGGTITKGQVLCLATATGKVSASNTTSATTSIIVGFALNDASVGDGVDVIQRGGINFLDLSSINYGTVLYAAAGSGNDGKVADAAPATTGDTIVPLGRVLGTSHVGGSKKVFFVDIQLSTVYAVAS